MNNEMFRYLENKSVGFFLSKLRLCTQKHVCHYGANFKELGPHVKGVCSFKRNTDKPQKVPCSSNKQIYKLLEIRMRRPLCVQLTIAKVLRNTPNLKML